MPVPDIKRLTESKGFQAFGDAAIAGGLGTYLGGPVAGAGLIASQLLSKYSKDYNDFLTQLDYVPQAGGIVALGKANPNRNKLLEKLRQVLKFDIENTPVLRWQQEGTDFPVSRGGRGQTYFKYKGALDSPQRTYIGDEISRLPDASDLYKYHSSPLSEGGSWPVSIKPDFPGTALVIKKMDYKSADTLKRLLGETETNRITSELYPSSYDRHTGIVEKLAKITGESKNKIKKLPLTGYRADDTYKVADFLMSHALEKAGISRTIRQSPNFDTDYTTIAPGDLSRMPDMFLAAIKARKHAEKLKKKGK